MPVDFERFDRIFVMDTGNLRDLQRQAFKTEHRDKVMLILNFCHPGQNRSVPDPYYDDDGFEEVFELLDVACERILEEM